MSYPIYHITHVENLAAIVAEGGLWCDREAAVRGVMKVGIAHQHIKDRRAQRRVPIGPGGTLDDFVPFYFAPRSPMLYAIRGGYVQGYSDGQGSVIHLASSVGAISDADVPFVFTDGHAEVDLSDFFDDLDDLDKIDWKIIKERYWADTDDDGDRKRRRQAEFLVHKFFDWHLVERIGVLDAEVCGRVKEILGDAIEKPLVTIERDWYY
jgi:hypothetical protein